MIKLSLREMKKISRILTMLLCCAPFGFAHASTVATTNGSNLTAFHASNVNNNQWATISNGRYDANANTNVKADFGNCNSIVLRCAQPKCSNGGCTDISLASAIVEGCVKSNESCKKYGDDLVNYMSAQLVASSNAKVKEQELAIQKAAAEAASAESQQQMAAMQQQMQQMQSQMIQQQQESQQQLQTALAQQAAQSQAALAEMKSAATNAAKEDEAGLSAYQKEAIERGISADVLERQKISGQIKTEIEDAETSLTAIKKVLQNAFEYAKCDTRGNNCEGPKRVKKWRELATDFVEPYNNAIDKIYDALMVAQGAGIDLSQIYMMLNNSCSSWGQYMCPQLANSHIEYPDVENGEKGVPEVVGDAYSYDQDCANKCYADFASGSVIGAVANSPEYFKCAKKCTKSTRKKCTLLKILTGENAVYDGWVNAEGSTSTGNTTVVACASGALDSSSLFASRARRKNGANLVDIEKIDTWLRQVEPQVKIRNEDTTPNQSDYCYKQGDMLTKLQSAVLKKTVDPKKLCYDEINTNNGGGKGTPNAEDCAFVDPLYAICDAHPYNAGYENLNKDFKDPRDCKDTLRSAENYKQIVWAQYKDPVNKQNCEVKLCVEKYKPNGSKTDCIDGDQSNRESVLADYKSYNSTSTAANETKEIIGLKTTVVSQQMYKQYEYLNATIRRLKTQLEKAIVKTNLEAAGAKTDEGSSSGGLAGGGSSKTSQYKSCSGKDIQEAIYCLRSNYSVLEDEVNKKKCNAAIKKQLANDLKIMAGKIPENKELYKQISAECQNSNTITKCETCLEEFSNGLNTLDDVRLDKEARRQGRYKD